MAVMNRGDDLQFVVGEPVQDGGRAVAERAEERQPGGLALVGVAQVDDPVVGGVVTGAADVPGLLEPVDDRAGAAGEALMPALPLPVAARALVMQALLFGQTSFEVFGRLDGVVQDSEVLFGFAIATMGDMLGFSPPD